MPKRILSLPGAGAPIAPFSAATVADGVVYVSGTLPFDDNNEVVHPGDAAEQTRHVLRSIARVLQQAGGTLADVCFNHVFLVDWADYAAINAAYAEFFPSDRPARFCVQVGLVKPGALVEIASVAHLGRPTAAAVA